MVLKIFEDFYRARKENLPFDSIFSERIQKKGKVLCEVKATDAGMCNVPPVVPKP